MTTNNDLDQLGGLWQSLDEGPAPARPVADIARRRRAQRLYLIIEMGIALAGSAVGIALISTGSLAIGIAALLFSAFGGVIGWMTRSMNLSVLERSVAEHLQASAAVLKARRNHNAGGVLMFVAASVFYGFVTWQKAGVLTGIDIAAMAGLLAAAMLFLVRARSAGRELARHQARSQGLGEE